MASVAPGASDNVTFEQMVDVVENHFKGSALPTGDRAALMAAVRYAHLQGPDHIQSISVKAETIDNKDGRPVLVHRLYDRHTGKPLITSEGKPQDSALAMLMFDARWSLMPPGYGQKEYDDAVEHNATSDIKRDLGPMPNIHKGLKFELIASLCADDDACVTDNRYLAKMQQDIFVSLYRKANTSTTVDDAINIMTARLKMPPIVPPCNGNGNTLLLRRITWCRPNAQDLGSDRTPAPERARKQAIAEAKLLRNDEVFLHEKVKQDKMWNVDCFFNTRSDFKWLVPTGKLDTGDDDGDEDDSDGDQASVMVQLTDDDFERIKEGGNFYALTEIKFKTTASKPLNGPRNTNTRLEFGRLMVLGTPSHPVLVPRENGVAVKGTVRDVVDDPIMQRYMQTIALSGKRLNRALGAPAEKRAKAIEGPNGSGIEVDPSPAPDADTTGDTEKEEDYEPSDDAVADAANKLDPIKEGDEGEEDEEDEEDEPFPQTQVVNDDEY